MAFLRRAMQAVNVAPSQQGNLGGKGTPQLTADPTTGRVDKDHHLAVITDVEMKALNYLKTKDKATGNRSGFGPELQELASKDTGKPPSKVNVGGIQVPSLNDYDESDEGEMGDDSTDPNSGTMESHYYTKSEQDWVDAAVAKSHSDSGDDGNNQQQQPVNKTETKDYSGDKPTLRGLYDAIAGDTVSTS